MKNKAQSTIEYSVLIAVVALALISMGPYLKRAIQGRARYNAEQLSGGGAYSPGATISDSTITKKINETSKSYSVKPSNATSDDEEVNITESALGIKQTTNRSEEAPSFMNEPKRWANGL